VRRPVVGLCYGAEAFLAGRVPYLQLDLFSVDVDSLDHEVHADGGALAGGKQALSEAAHQTGLAHPGVADEHHLEQELVVLHLRSHPWCLS